MIFAFRNQPEDMGQVPDGGWVGDGIDKRLIMALCMWMHAAALILFAYAESRFDTTLFEFSRELRDFHAQFGIAHRYAFPLFRDGNQRGVGIVILQKVFGEVQRRFGKPAAARKSIGINEDFVARFADDAAK